MTSLIFLIFDINLFSLVLLKKLGKLRLLAILCTYSKLPLVWWCLFDPFQLSILFLYLLKRSKNLTSDVFRGYINEPLTWNGLISFIERKVYTEEKCLYLEFFCSVFSRIWTAYGEIQSISPSSVRMRESMDQINSEYGHFSRSGNVK